jgi:hypothetical protein
MEQPCYKCGQSLEEGTPFCPHCSAPQIRVIVAEPVAAPAAASDLSPSQQSQALPASQTIPVLAVSMQWSRAVKPCALAAMIACLLMALRLHPAMAIFTAGFLSVVFYRISVPGVAVKTSSAAGLGALGGILWFAIAAIFSILGLVVLHKGPELRSEMINVIGQAASQTTDPQVLAMFDRFKSPAGLEILIVAGSLFALVFAILLGGVGGSLAGIILGRRGKS